MVNTKKNPSLIRCRIAALRPYQNRDADIRSSIPTLSLKQYLSLFSFVLVLGSLEKAKRQRGGFVERCFLSVGGFGCALEELREAETEYRVLDCFDAFETQKELFWS
ncbi:hypothetical protein PVK06_044881 [Gossypium arboreum]|uniref:Uncharacterized protein n=1 Tax=Gossypium arboreum TaxID=29729 RepID=A0ABR0MSF6_GOSAR|nr:hypothetical protein PVK06_044881 [Gossypium arboreum]